MKTSVVLIFILIITLSSTCGEMESECNSSTHNGFTVKNNSLNRIIPYIYWNYPDTLIGTYNPVGFGIINPGDESYGKSPGPLSCWESYLKNNKKENLYFFDEDSLEVIPWETVRETNRGLLERRVIDLEYLQNNGFVVTYP